VVAAKARAKTVDRIVSNLRGIHPDYGVRSMVIYAPESGDLSEAWPQVRVDGDDELQDAADYIPHSIWEMFVADCRCLLRGNGHEVSVLAVSGLEE
jgi:hypothetical protein